MHRLCPPKAAGLVSRKHHFLQVYRWCGSWWSDTWLIQVQNKKYILLPARCSHNKCFHLVEALWSLSLLQSFQIQLAKELMAEYCSWRRRGLGGAVVHPLPFRYFPVRLSNDSGPLYSTQQFTPACWHYMVESGVWLCHNGDPTTHCFMRWHHI